MLSRLPLRAAKFGLASVLATFSLARGANVVSFTLEEAVALALAKNPGAEEARSRLDEAEARLRVERSAGRPTLKARGAYDYGTDDQRLAPAERNGEAGAFGNPIMGAELIATLPILTGGRVSGATEAAEWLRRGAAEELTRVRESLVYEVTATFHGLLAQDAVVRSLETAVLAMDEQQRTVQELVDAEKAARVDLLRANVRRAELYERQVREKSSRTIQQHAWGVLLGLDDGTVPDARGRLTLGVPPPCPDSEICMILALGQRTDLRAARAAVAAVEAGVRAARAGYRPKLSAQASYGVRWLADPSEQPDGQEDHHNAGRAGLVLEIPLFDGDLTRAKVAEQAARQRGSEERVRRLELQIRFEVESALAEIASALERVQTSEQSVGQAEESYRIMKEKYDLGKGTMTDVLDAQTALVTAETSLARALADLAISDARRKLAVGERVP